MYVYLQTPGITPTLCGLGDTAPTSGGGINWGGGAAGGIASGVMVGMTTGSAKRSAIASVGGFLTSIAAATGPAAPFVAAIGGIVVAMSTMFRGCGQSCIETSKLADQASKAFDDIKAAYWALPAPRPKTAQTAALAALDDIAGQLQAACSNPAFGAAGERCISERLVRGGTAPWCPTPDHRGCDFFTVIRDPIANDPDTYEDSAAAQMAEALGVNEGGSGLGLLALGLVLVGVML